MNAKAAKRLRKMTQLVVADQLSKGNEVSDKTTYIEQESRRKYGKLAPTFEQSLAADFGLSDTTSTDQMQVIARGTIMTTPVSVRGIYLALKKGQK